MGHYKSSGGRGAVSRDRGVFNLSGRKPVKFDITRTKRGERLRRRDWATEMNVSKHLR